MPFSTTTVITTERAEEAMLALSVNYEYDLFGVQGAAYYRRFRDADPSLFERNLLDRRRDRHRARWSGSPTGSGVAVDGS